MNASTIAQDSFASGKLTADNSELKKIKQPDPVLQHLENLHPPFDQGELFRGGLSASIA